mmetsp:Transcript_8474/g.25089  ORF Transcript_8474/g.25089 Transcript_8474/m.25089 type:complete len:289 (+) Transcript_8474:3891-4757(+)
MTIAMEIAIAKEPRRSLIREQGILPGRNGCAVAGPRTVPGNPASVPRWCRSRSTCRWCYLASWFPRRRTRTTKTLPATSSNSDSSSNSNPSSTPRHPFGIAGRACSSAPSAADWIPRSAEGPARNSTDCPGPPRCSSASFAPACSVPRVASGARRTGEPGARGASGHASAWDSEGGWRRWRSTNCRWHFRLRWKTRAVFRSAWCGDCRRPRCLRGRSGGRETCCPRRAWRIDETTCSRTIASRRTCCTTIASRTGGTRCGLWASCRSRHRRSAGETCWRSAAPRRWCF